MKIEKMTPHIGARITGLDLRDLRISDRSFIRDLLEDNLVLFFEDQDLDDEQFAAYGRVVGDLDQLELLKSKSEDMPEVQIVEVAPGSTLRGVSTDSWHSDAPYLERPPFATTIKPVYLPPVGGDTLWASMYAAYELLSAPVQRMADELQVIQGIRDYTYAHPVVRVNPRTGRKGLNINSIFSQKIVGLGKIESQKLIDMFCTLSTLPDVQCRYQWKPHSVAIWDNRFTQHFAVADYSAPRKMHRLSVLGEPVLSVGDYNARSAPASLDSEMSLC